MIGSPDIAPDAGVARRRTPEGDRQWGPILVGTDGSEGAGRAIDAAGGLAAELDTDLWIAHVMDRDSDTVVRQVAHSEETSIGDVTETMARRVLIEAAEWAEAGGLKKLHTLLRWGSCAEELVAAAREVGAKAIVVGRRGAGGRLTQALIGSVSQKLAGIAPVNLVIVP